MFGALFELITGSDANEWNISFKREYLKCEDNGEVILDWSYPNIDKANDDYRGYPIMILFPGLTGTSNDIYILNAIREAHSHGYVAVVSNHRGFPGTKLKTPKLYHAAHSDDVRNTVNYLKR